MSDLFNLSFLDRSRLDRHYEVYFESSVKSSPNLLTLEHLQSLCKKQTELIDLFELHSTCHYTLPQLVAYFANKADCRQLVESDIGNFIERIQRCHSLYDTGLIRLAGLHRYRIKPLELFQYDTCFRYNFTFLTLEYLLDKTFLETNETRYTAMWFLKPDQPIRTANGSEVHTTDTAYELFIEHFYENPKFDDGSTRISALNFLDIRIPTAMKQIRVDMFFVILAITLIVAVSASLLPFVLVHCVLPSGDDHLSPFDHRGPDDEHLRSSLLRLRLFHLQSGSGHRSLSVHQSDVHLHSHRYLL